ncbi:MAG TPA: cyclic nucleotide-binding domain-containing protein [Fimbriimonadaceae bacterium]|nr:cyclic nucleotide-binding domain-containing protein [Fimbriimonadaceae bacterium]HRJ31946.1 cyclic nucleotide-binding domain-containing protein [Fimbriimonadaceae bacterium]
MSTNTLSDNYLMQGASADDVAQVHAISEVRDYAGGDILVSARGSDQDIMVILEGKVRVESPQGDLIHEFREGAMIGEIAFLDGQSRTANVVAMGPSKVLVIPANKLKALLVERPSLGLAIYRNASIALSQRLREANQQIESLMVPR